MSNTYHVLTFTSPLKQHWYSSSSSSWLAELSLYAAASSVTMGSKLSSYGCPSPLSSVESLMKEKLLSCYQKKQMKNSSRKTCLFLCVSLCCFVVFALHSESMTSQPKPLQRFPQAVQFIVRAMAGGFFTVLRRCFRELRCQVGEIFTYSCILKSKCEINTRKVGKENATILSQQHFKMMFILPHTNKKKVIYSIIRSGQEA